MDLFPSGFIKKSNKNELILILLFMQKMIQSLFGFMKNS